MDKDVKMDREEQHLPTLLSSPSSSDTDEPSEELGCLALAPPCTYPKRLSKQLSLRETSLEAAWEKRRRDIRHSRLGRRSLDLPAAGGITDEDLAELKGCIDLGFGFNEEDGQGSCNTLPALHLFFAVNRGFGISRSSASSPLGSPSRTSPNQADSWKIWSPGDDPEDVKTRLRHWAQIVACSARQSSESKRF